MSGYPFYPYGRGGVGDDASAMSDYPFYPYGRGGVGDDAAAARYSSYEIDLIAARYAGDPSPYPSASGGFDPHVGARRPSDGESSPFPVLLSGSVLLRLFDNATEFCRLHLCGSIFVVKQTSNFSGVTEFFYGYGIESENINWLWHLARIKMRWYSA